MSGLWEDFSIAISAISVSGPHTSQHRINDQECLLSAFPAYLSLGKELQPNTASFIRIIKLTLMEERRKRGLRSPAPMRFERNLFL